jgi:hypothetical protein
MAQRRDWNWQQLLEAGMQFTNELALEGRERADELAGAFRREAHKAGAKKPAGSS